jgi:hypothetical protein
MKQKMKFNELSLAVGFSQRNRLMQNNSGLQPSSSGAKALVCWLIFCPSAEADGKLFFSG